MQVSALNANAVALFADTKISKKYRHRDSIPVLPECQTACVCPEKTVDEPDTRREGHAFALLLHHIRSSAGGRIHLSRTVAARSIVHRASAGRPRSAPGSESSPKPVRSFAVLLFFPQNSLQDYGIVPPMPSCTQPCNAAIMAVLFRTVRSCNPAFPPSSWHLSFRSLREGSAGSAGQLGAAAGEPGHAPRYAPAALTAMAHAMVVAGCCAGQRPRSVRSLSHCGTASRDTNKRGGRV